MTPADRRPPRGARRGFSWALVLVGAVLVAVIAVIASQMSRSPAGSSSAGLPIGAPAPSIARPATTGGSLSLDQLRGSKVVVYFYEGAG